VYSKCYVFKRVVFTLFVATPASLAGSDLPSSNNIPRFQMLTTGLYRGGQPDKKGFELLKQQGVKTIINLRMENGEETTVKQLGMNCVQIAIDDPRPASRIPEQAVSKYFEIVEQPGKLSDFLPLPPRRGPHRRHGRDVSDCESGMGCRKSVWRSAEQRPSLVVRDH